jgi:D-alanine transaminase
METLANVNGKLMPLKDVTISAQDRGFLFGDAIYEVLRVYHGKPWLMEGHMRRLAQSLESIRITGVDLPRIQRRMMETIAAGPFSEAMVYIQITRGAAPRAHKFPQGVAPLELLWVQEFKDPYQEMRQAGCSVITQPDIRWDRCDIKSTNLLGNVLALQSAVEAGCVEALFYLPDGTMTEGTHTSFFGVLDGSLLTAPNSHAILPGITRGLVLRLAERAKIPVREHVLTRKDLARVSELFLTGTTSEVLPIVRVDDRPVAEGRPGPITRRLQEVYAEAVREFLKA